MDKNNECPICFRVPMNKFFKLICCQQEICEECWKLIQPKLCPFCRTDLTNLAYWQSVSEHWNDKAGRIPGTDICLRYNTPPVIPAYLVGHGK